jgi:RNA polymerase sigma-70 factor (ECF subfamily)
MIYASRPANCGARAYGRRADYHSHVSEGQKRNARPASGGAVGYGLRRLVRTQKEGQELEAFQEMSLASRQKFVRMAYAILRNKEDAEDAVQNAVLSAYLHLRTFQGRSALTTWLTRIVLNAALMIQRKRRASRIDPLPEPRATDDTAWMERIPDSQPDPEMACAEGETFQLIDSVLGGMTPALRQAFRMTYYDEMSIREACALLGVSTGTFKSRLFRARRHLLNEANRFLARPVHKRTALAFSFAPNDVQPRAASAADISSLQVALS